MCHSGTRQTRPDCSIECDGRCARRTIKRNRSGFSTLSAFLIAGLIVLFHTAAIAAAVSRDATVPH